MQMEHFAQGFAEEAPLESAPSKKKWPSRARSLMSPSLQWSDFFSQAVDAHLTAEPQDPTSLQALDTYTNNSNRQLFQHITDSFQGLAFEYPSLVSHLNRLNFHSMSQEMPQSWAHIISPETHPVPDYIDLSVMQTRLSIRGLQLVAARQKYFSQTLARTPHPVNEALALDESFAGQITEVDAAITLLEMIKQPNGDDHEELVVVPGPAKYESGNKHDKASDFLLFDTKERQAIGVQVKTNLRGMGKYDRQFVTFIDGRKDLHNQAERILPNGRPVQIAAPGLIAADFVLHNEGLARESAYRHIEGLKEMTGQISYAKSIAHTLEDKLDYPQRAAVAAEKIRSRMLYALYEDDTELAKNKARANVRP